MLLLGIYTAYIYNLKKIFSLSLSTNIIDTYTGVCFLYEGPILIEKSRAQEYG